MNRRDIEKLLGGYATGTLTDEEREALFEAALEDQALFDALAREQALRDLLAEPAAKAHLMAALGEARPPFAARFAAWLLRPQAIALAASAAVALVAVALFVPRGSAPVQEEAVEVATAKRPEPVLAPREEPLREAAPVRAKEEAPKRAAKPAAPPLRAMEDLAAEAPVPTLPAPPPVSESVVVDAAPPPVTAAAPPPPPLKREVAYSAQLARTNAVRVEEKMADATRGAPMPGAGVVAGAVARRQPARAPGTLRYSALDPLHTGGPIRLRFDSRESGWLYVLVAEREGWRLAASDQIEGGRLRVVSVQFEEPGRKELLAIVSRTEQPDLSRDKTAIPPAAAASLRIILIVTQP